MIITTAIMPALKTLESEMALGLTPVKNRMSAPAASMTNWITGTIVSGCPLASSGSSGCATEARQTMATMPSRKIVSALRACELTASPSTEWLPPSMYSRILGSCILAWKSGSSARSLPRFRLQVAATSMPMMHEGTVTHSTWGTEMATWWVAAMATTVARAADTGLAVMPIWLATEAIAIGRSGRIPLEYATS